MTYHYTTIFAALIFLFVPVSCKPKPIIRNELQMSAEMHHQIKDSFNQAFPNAIDPFKKSPSISSIGEMVTSSPRFVLDDFPQSDLTQLKSWAQPLIASLDIESITLSYFEDDPELKAKNIFPRLSVIRYNYDGTIENRTGVTFEEAFPEGSIKGKAIQTK